MLLFVRCGRLMVHVGDVVHSVWSSYGTCWCCCLLGVVVLWYMLVLLFTRCGRLMVRAAANGYNNLPPPQLSSLRSSLPSFIHSELTHGLFPFSSNGI